MFILLICTSQGWLSRVTGHFSQKANRLGSCILTRNVVSFYGPLSRWLWLVPAGGGEGGEHPPQASSYGAGSPGQALLPVVILVLPFQVLTYFQVQKRCSRYCIIYFPFCSIVNPVNPELKPTTWIEKGLWALPNPPEIGFVPGKEPTRGSATLPLTSLNFHGIKYS